MNQAALPQALEAEKAVVGAILRLEGMALTPARRVLAGSEDFHERRHRLIYEAVLRLSGRGDPTDLIAVEQELRSSRADEDAGGIAYLQELAMDAPESAANIEYHAGLVHDAARRRNLVNWGERMARAACLPGANADELEQGLRDAGEMCAGRQAQAGERALPSLLDLWSGMETERLQEADGKIGVGISLRPLREALGGRWWPGMHIIMGKPKEGKTQLVLLEALGAARDGAEVAYLSLELPPRQVTARILGMATGQSWVKLLSDGEALSAARVQVGDELLSRIRIFDGASIRLTPEDVEGVAYRLKALADRAQRPALLILDYLQRLSGRGEVRDQVRAASNALSAFGVKYRIPILTVSSIGRQAYERMVSTGEWPSLDSMAAAAKESGEAEYGAESLIAIVHKYQDPKAEQPVISESRLALALCRRYSSRWIRGQAFSEGGWVDDEERRAGGGSGMGKDL
jgi:replicative DNA helicase